MEETSETTTPETTTPETTTPETTTSSTDTLTNVVIATLVDPSEFNENYVVIATPIHSDQRMY